MFSESQTNNPGQLIGNLSKQPNKNQQQQQSVDSNTVAATAVAAAAMANFFSRPLESLCAAAALAAATSNKQSIFISNRSSNNDGVKINTALNGSIINENLDVNAFFPKSITNPTHFHFPVNFEKINSEKSANLISKD